MRKPGIWLLSFTMLSACVASQQAEIADIYFGDDSIVYARDGECDDPRFTGLGTVNDVDWTSVGRDATDCRRAVANGARYWLTPSALVPVDCEATDFGEDDLEEGVNDGICDDGRFITLGGAYIHLYKDSQKDATDCQRVCAAGMLFQRAGK